MTKKLAIFCDCDSSGGMLTYTLTLLDAIKDVENVKTVVITSRPQSDDDVRRHTKLSECADTTVTLERGRNSAASQAEYIAQKLVELGVDYYIPNYRYAPHRALSHLPPSIKNIAVVHNDSEDNYQTIRFYASALCGVIFPSRMAFSKYKEPLLTHAKKALIPHYLPPLEQSTEPALRDEDVLTLVYHGRVAHTQKKSLELITIAKQLKATGVRFKLNIIGHGDALADVKNQAHECGLDEINIIGAVDRADLHTHLAGADIALSTSEYEGFCYSIAEALSLGIVPVVYENDVIKDLVSNDINGYSVAWGDAKGVAGRIQYLDSNREKLTELKANAQKSVQDITSKEIYRTRMLDFLSELDAMPNPRPWPKWKPRSLNYDTFLNRTLTKVGRRLKFW